jgi:hypothetical protein
MTARKPIPLTISNPWAQGRRPLPLTPRPPTEAERVFDAAFDAPRDSRSVEYKKGALAALRYRLEGAPSPVCPYSVGTCQADAWWAGMNEGHALFRAAKTATD